MAPSISNPTPAQCLSLLPKLNDADADIRYMSLNDLYSLLTAGASTFLTSEYHTSAKIIDGIIQALDDQNGEVQNQAIKCVGALVLKLPADILAPFIHRVSNIKTTHSVDTSIPTTALRTFITSFPSPLPGLPPPDKTSEAYLAISTVMIPRLLGYLVFPPPQVGLPAPPPGMLEIGSPKGVNSDAVDVLVEIIRCFGPMLRDAEKQALQKTLMTILYDGRTGSVVKKKAVVAISILCVYMQSTLLKSLVSQVIEAFKGPGLTIAKRRLLLTTIGSISRSVPQRLGPHAKSLMPFVLTPLSEQEFQDADIDLEDGEPNVEVEELREAALVALEGFLTCCSNDIRDFTNESIDAAVRYVSYDPNAASDEDDEMDGAHDDENEDAYDGGEEDFEQDVAFSDDEDASWKIRRCAAKALFAIISTRSNGDLLESGTLYDKIAPVLVKRFKEREENVRLEVIVTLALLIKKTGESSAVGTLPVIDKSMATTDSRRSRKRRRVDSTTEPPDAAGAFAVSLGLNSPAASPSPVSGPRAELARLNAAIVKGVSQLLKQSSIPTRQTAISLLRESVLVQNGGLSDHLSKIIDPLLDIIRTASNAPTGSSSTAVGGVAAASGGIMRIEALQLLGAICDSHSSNILASYLDRIVSAAVSAVKDSNYKVSGAALQTLEGVVKAMTPPRTAGTEKQRIDYLSKVYEVVSVKATSLDVDLEARRKAIHALSVVLARTSGTNNTKLLAADKRSNALDILHDRLNNETTRLSAVKAIEIVAVSATDKNDLPPSWIESVSLELGAQLRKADRDLRGASLAALRSLTHNPRALSKLDESTVQSLATLLLPLVSAGDFNLLAVALSILSRLVKSSHQTVTNASLNKALCDVIISNPGGRAFEALLTIVQDIGEQGVGQPLMHQLLQEIGVSGDPTIVGKVIGTLFVSGSDTVGVTLKQFESELRNSKDYARQCLALSILGEVGSRMGPSFPLQSDIFTDRFSSKSDTVRRTAAIALGRAGSGNIKACLPTILSYTNKTGQLQYLSLYSIKEVLQNAGSSRSDVSPYTKKIWDNLHAASQLEDNKTLGAECIGRITAIQPGTFLPLLQGYLKEKIPTVRSMAIQAVRFTFADNDETFDEALKPILVDMLSIMLNDPNTENRRLALGTFNSAFQHKSDMISPHLSILLPLVMKDSHIDPDLIREVQMGPFRHKVDEGLELRKSAYETLFSLMETAYPRINHADLFDRVTAGLEDEHEIKMLCNLMLTKLIDLDSDETARRLDPIAEKLRVIMSFKPKENSVKQEVEKAAEASKAALKVTVRLHNSFPTASSGSSGVQSQNWKGYWEWLSKEHKALLMNMENEVKTQAA